MRFGKKNQQNLLSFKKRFFWLCRHVNIQACSPASLFFCYQIKIEFLYLRIMRRLLKRFVRKKKKHFLNRQVWLNLKVNYPLSKKAKNARMGKGKGAFLRWVVLIKSYHPILNFYGFAFLNLKRFIKRLQPYFKEGPKLIFLFNETSPSVIRLEKFYTNAALRFKHF